MKRKLPVIIAILLVLTLAGCAVSNPASVNDDTATHILTKEEVKTLTFSHAKVEEAKVTDLEVDLDEDDGIIFYDLEFEYQDTEYDYRVDALSGKILYNKAEPKETASQQVDTPPAETGHAETKPAEEKPEATKPAEEKPKETKPATTTTKKKIGVAAAKSAAFKHANVKASDAWDVEVDLDTENGKLVYEVSFDAVGYEYDYDIDAYTGKVLRNEKEKSD